MALESLANELLLDIFEYHNTTDLFHAFYGLNSRFNQLLLIHFQHHGHFNFESISKINFDIICQQYLPKTIDRIISIHLSDDNETPQQINLFLSNGFQFHQFIYLKSLSLNHIYSEQIMINIITDLHQLNYLTYLKINGCRVDSDLINNGWIFDQIWSLSKLTHCHFVRQKYLWNPFFISPKLISLSIKYLYLEGFSYNSDELHRLFERTINLEKLNIDIDHNYDYQKISSMISSMKKLQISVQYSPYITENLLEYMPNLIELNIELSHFSINGYRWEEIINNYLINLKIFHFKMEVFLGNIDQKEQQMNQFLDSFRTKFWTNQHQWYIQCHWYLSEKSSKSYLYTLPYRNNNFLINSNIQFKSTYPNNEIHWCYDDVDNLSFNESTRYPIRFNNLKNLKISLPFADSFWSIVPNFNRLVSLNVKLSNDVKDQLQLETLLQRATHLHSLTLIGCLNLHHFLFNLKSPSIRRLSLYDFGCFNQKQCDNLINSPLGIQCEVLFIVIKYYTNILNLVNGMKNLRILNVRCQDDQWDRADEPVQWLKDCLPHCIITRGETIGISYINLWIR